MSKYSKVTFTHSFYDEDDNETVVEIKAVVQPAERDVGIMSDFLEIESIKDLSTGKDFREITEDEADQIEQQFFYDDESGSCYKPYRKPIF